MEFSRQEYWSGLPCPSPGNLLNPGIEPESPALQTNPYRLSRQGSPQLCSPSHLPRYQGVKLKQISGGEAKSTFFPPILILDIIILKNLCHLSIITESSGKDFLIIISTTEIRRNFHIFVWRCEIGTTTTICTNLEQFVSVKKIKCILFELAVLLLS